MKNINKTYLKISILLFIIEVIIALFINDQFVRPLFGDYLASILLFYLMATFIRISENRIAVYALLTSYIIELLQYIQILKLVKMNKIKIVTILFVTSFSWIDILAYTLGILTVVVLHNFKKLQT